MNIMKIAISPLLGLAAIVCLTACDQQQTKVLALQEEYQRQLHTKDASIEELNQKVQALQHDKDALSDKLIKAMNDPQSGDKIVKGVAEVVDARLKAQLDARFSELKSRLDQMDTGIKAAQTMAKAAAEAPPPAREPAPNPGITSQPSSRSAPVSDTPKVKERDPNVKRFKIEF